MPLILAIEPDRRQASHLTAMVRGRLHAEFVIGDSAQHALEALGSRVPDLVLTTALLSPKDEAALGERLRALDGAAAHVQTLTIPVLATPGRGRRSAKPAGGMLSVLLGDKGDGDGPAGGCDPAVFAEQCKEYLVRAAHERAQAVDRLEPPSESHEEPVVPSEALVPVRVRYTRTDDDDPPSSLMAAVAAFAEDEPFVNVADAPDGMDVARDVVNTAQELGTPSTTDDDDEIAAHDQFVDVDLSSMLDDPNRVRAAEASDAGDDEDEPALEVYDIDTNVLEPTVLGDSQPAMAALAGESVQSVDEPAATIDEAAATVSEAGPYTPLPRPEVRTWPILEGLTTGAVTADTIAEINVQAPQPKAVRETEDLAEWSDIIEALRRDARPALIMREQPTQVEPVDAAAPDPVAAASGDGQSPPVPESASPEAPNGNGPRRRRKSPVQDEWGFFDPDRAGFSALLAKLEEITEDDATPQPQRT
jgi:hypothetical protein